VSSSIPVALLDVFAPRRVADRYYGPPLHDTTLDPFLLDKPCGCGSRHGVWRRDRTAACRRCGQRVSSGAQGKLP
jgi:hypothetical protein